MPLLALSWPARPLFILAFCPPSIVPRCLPGEKLKGRILNAAPLSPYHCCPVTEASAKHVYQFLLSESRCPPPNAFRNSALSMGNYTGPSLGVSFFVLT